MTMFFDTISVPFKIVELFSGLAEGRGILRVDETALTLELQVTDALFGLLKSRIINIQLPFDQVSGIIMTKGWFRKKLILRTHSMAPLTSIPGHSGNELVLVIRRRDRDSARFLISRLELRKTEVQLQKLEEW